MKLRLLALGISLAAALPTVKAQSFLEVVSGSAARTTTSATQVVGAGVDFTVGKLRLSLDQNQRAFITYTFEGAEAGLRQQFYGAGGHSMLDSQAGVGAMLTTQVNGGILDFGFQSAGGALMGNRHNYGWNDANVGIVLDSNRMSGRLLFEDGRSRLGSDYDYDDMVVRFNVNVVPVPEASTLAMLGAGLGVLALVGRRRKPKGPRVTPV